MNQIPTNSVYSNEIFPDDFKRIEISCPKAQASTGLALNKELVVFPDNLNGLIEATVTDLPAGLTVFLASATEINIHDGTPHRGAAPYDTLGVSLHSNSRVATIRFRIHWGAPLRSGVMCVYG